LDKLIKLYWKEKFNSRLGGELGKYNASSLFTTTSCPQLIFVGTNEFVARKKLKP